MKSELNSRQWALYNLYKDGGVISQLEAAQLLKKDFPEYGKFTDERAFHDSAARLVMTKDIRAINASPIIQKTIVRARGGLKLANKADAERNIKAKYKTAFRTLASARQAEKKAALDGQLRAVFGNEREIIHAFTDSNVEGDELKKARQAAGLTQKQAVDALKTIIDIDAPTLSKIENGVVAATEKQKAAFSVIYSAIRATV